MNGLLTRFTAFILLASFAYSPAQAAGTDVDDNPLEEAGIIRSVNSAGGTVTIGTRTMRLADDLQATSPEGRLQNVELSFSWLGKKVGYLWYEDSPRRYVITHIHFFDFHKIKGK